MHQNTAKQLVGRYSSRKMEAGLQLYISQTNIITEHKMTVTTIPHIETDWSCSRKMEAGLHTADKLSQSCILVKNTSKIHQNTAKQLVRQYSSRKMEAGLHIYTAAKL